MYKKPGFYPRHEDTSHLPVYRFNTVQDYLRYDWETQHFCGTPEEYDEYFRCFNGNWSSYVPSDTLSSEDIERDYDLALQELEAKANEEGYKAFFSEEELRNPGDLALEEEYDSLLTSRSSSEDVLKIQARRRAAAHKVNFHIRIALADDVCGKAAEAKEKIMAHYEVMINLANYYPANYSELRTPRMKYAEYRKCLCVFQRWKGLKKYLGGLKSKIQKNQPATASLPAPTTPSVSASVHNEAYSVCSTVVNHAYADFSRKKNGQCLIYGHGHMRETACELVIVPRPNGLLPSKFLLLHPCADGYFRLFPLRRKQKE